MAPAPQRSRLTLMPDTWTAEDEEAWQEHCAEQAWRTDPGPELSDDDVRAAWEAGTRAD